MIISSLIAERPHDLRYSLPLCKLTLSLINVLSFRITTDQYRTLNGSIYAVHQSFSGFNTAELGRLHSAQLSLVMWELALACDGSPLFATLARILLSLVVTGLPCCFTAGGNTGSDAINFTYRNFRLPIWRYNYRSSSRSRALNTSRASNTGRGSNVVVLIEAGPWIQAGCRI